MNHDVVLVIHINKFGADINSIIHKSDIQTLLTSIPSPLFSLHIEYPGSVVSFSHVIEGFDLFASGINGKNANLDLVSVVLNHLPILSYEGYIHFGHGHDHD